jgi:hypothetical protein
MKPLTQKYGAMSMTYRKSLYFVTIFAIILIFAFGVRSHFAKARAAKSEHVAPPAQYFPSGAIWNREVTQASVDERSSAIIGWLSSVGGWGHGRLQVDFSLRVLQADANTPTVRVHVNSDGPDSDKLSSIPLPAHGGLEGQADYKCPDEDNDCHLIVVDRSNAKLYESYHANYSGNSLTTVGITVWDLNRVYPPSGRGDQCSSADAAGFPIAPLVFNADELASGSINHAIRFVLPNPRIRAGVFVHPATHAGAPRGPLNAPPYGAHFRLKSSFDISQLSPAAQVVARAMQKYGMFLSDGGNIALTAQSDADTQAKYSDLNFGPHDMEAIKVTDFEVLDLGKPIELTYDCVRSK